LKRGLNYRRAPTQLNVEFPLLNDEEINKVLDGLQKFDGENIRSVITLEEVNT